MSLKLNSTPMAAIAKSSNG
ncbi:hypothetical protein B4U79_14798 [Dinothrombium tinctorium]|uniref:Uncharacterized protein n=1 Tax=Dinothrombium tinctorium TaxID=1965070 RepID=A0A443RGS3_9ACAR|nr:hypothetical protein B4U79_14798 [Dinothrombium tinctorium]